MAIGIVPALARGKALRDAICFGVAAGSVAAMAAWMARPSRPTLDEHSIVPEKTILYLTSLAACHIATRLTSLLRYRRMHQFN